MNLVIDIGNSRVKLFLFKNDKITFRSLCNHNEFITTLQTLPFREEIINVISSTVSVNYDDIIELNYKNSNYFKLSKKNLKLPYRDQLIELGKLYKIEELKIYAKSKKDLTISQIELILLKNTKIQIKVFMNGFN